MTSLDAPGAFAVDATGCLGALTNAPAAFDAAIDAARDADIMFPADAVDDVVIAGVGPSASVGAILIDAFWERLRKPVRVVSGYGLPGWVGERTLVIGATLSGATEETLTCVADAVDRTCPTVGISTGGKMTGFYGPAGVPIITPPAAPTSRVAGIAMLGAMVAVLERFGVLHHLDGDLAEGRERLSAAVSAYGPAVTSDANPAKRIAGSLLGAVPIIWGAQATASQAERWADQIQANAKAVAFTARFPDYDHAGLAAAEHLPEAGIRPHLVILRDPRHHRQVQRRLDATQQLLAPMIAGTTTVLAEGRTDLARLIDLLLLGDFASLYLACLRGVDPASEAMAERLADVLATTGYGRTATGS